MKRALILFTVLLAAISILSACNINSLKKPDKCKDGHSYGEWAVSKEPDCVNCGEKIRVCSVCKKGDIEVVAAKGHSFDSDSYGYREADGHAYKCTACGEHNTVVAHTPGAAATETEAEVCTVCDYIITEPLGHIHVFDLEIENERTVKSFANCDSPLTCYKSCSCGEVSDTETFTVGEPLNHEYGEWIIVKKPDCENKGSKKRACSVCKTEETAEVDALGHEYNTEVYGYQDAVGHANKCSACGAHNTVVPHTPGSAATETEPEKCTVCQYVIAPAMGHTHNFILEVKNEVTFRSAATCEEPITYYKSCSCGAVSETETFTEGEANGHKLGEWETYKEATAFEKGEMRKNCKYCDHYESEEIPAKEPNMDPGGWTPVN